VKRLLVQSAVRLRFRLTGTKQASAQIRNAMERYLKLAATMGSEKGRRCAQVPPMLEVDEDMRGWSVFLILEHNAIVNRSIRVIVQSLAHGDEPPGMGAIDPKKDVMPSANPGEEQVGTFRRSVEEYLEMVETLPLLRGMRPKRHPAFGDLDAHGWHCMFGLHLDIHLKQARSLVRLLTG
jgi:hypothetical protein